MKTLGIIPKKYRQILLAVAAFLVFDLGVLVLNFYTSYQISADAVSINLAGRERMLSQRMTKSLLALQADTEQGKPATASLKELRTTVDLFGSSFNAFQHGGTVKGGNNQPVMLKAVTTEIGVGILGKAQTTWQPYLSAINTVLASQAGDANALNAAVTFGRANNVKLLTLMNDLTTHLESEASAKASRLRMIQTIGIALALLNFGFILFHFLRQLRESDQVIEAAQQETQEILSTVKEGLFLLGRDFHIGTQASASLTGIFGDKARPGADLFSVLDGQLSAETLAAARDYVELLFGERVKESLMGDLNPLSMVEMHLSNASGEPETRYISVQFNRVRVQGKISHLLVTAQDVSEQVRLERELAAADVRTQGEVEALLKLLTVDSASLMQYLDQAQASLLEINSQLKDDSGFNQNYLNLVNGIFRRVHGLKGDAAMLGLDTFELLAQEFEDLLRRLREQPRISGNDLVAIPLKLDTFLERIQMVRSIAQRLGTISAPVIVSETLAGRFEQLAARIAQDHGKTVKLHAELVRFDSLNTHTQTTVSDIALQLLRNAVAHGIEAPAERASHAKPQLGTVAISLDALDSGEYELKVRDDGQGLLPERIREKLVHTGRYSAAQVAQWDDKQIIMQIFEPGFSTLDIANRDAGQGVGLDMVKDKITRLGARLRIASRPHQFTEFSIRFAVPA
jgi:HPt (histidine-containing phosphotransfer) domain-containing protein